MNTFSKKQAVKRERTLLIAFLLSAPGPIVVGFAAFSSSSSTQFADFIRRSAELVSLFMAWWVFRYIRHGIGLSGTSKHRLERRAGLCTAITMLFSSVLMLVIAVPRLLHYVPSGNVLSGMVIAGLGLVVNTFFWQKYRVMSKETYNTVIGVQQMLYRAKAFVDMCVLLALSAVFLQPNHPATRYVDITGAVIVSAYLFYSSMKAFRETLAAQGRAFEC